MTINQFAENTLGIPPAPVQLACMWHVDQDALYDVHPQRFVDHHAVLIRTMGGEGLLTLRNEQQYALLPNSLIMVDMPNIKRYHTVGSRWAFEWFEMQPMHHTGIEPDTLYELPVTPFELQCTEQIIQMLEMPDRGAQTAANALFASLFCWWLWQMPSHGHFTQNMRQLVWQAVDIMKQQISDAPSISEIAGQMHVSDRWLRQAFVRVLGISPKRYQEQLRLSLAASALRMENCSISQLTERYGYGSPFHFSRAFKQRYGVSPSRYRQHGIQPDDTDI